MSKSTKVNDNWVVYPPIDNIDWNSVDIDQTVKELSEKIKNKHMEDSNKIDAENTASTTDLVENEVVELEMSPLDEDFLDKEPEELTEEQIKEAYIKALKSSKIRFNKIKQVGNVTTNQFGADYQKARQRKNKIAKQSRKRNLK